MIYKLMNQIATKKELLKMEFKQHQKLKNAREFRTELGFEAIALLANYFKEDKLDNCTAEWCMQSLKDRYYELLKENEYAAVNDF